MEPGYYQATASVSVATMSERWSDRRGRAPESEVIDKTVWLLITELGGRLDETFDRSILQSKDSYLLHGSTGPFRSLRGKAESADLVSYSSSRSVTFRGRIVFQENDGFGNISTQAIPNLRIVGFCSSIWGEALSSYDLVSDSTGSFSVACSDDTWSIRVEAALADAGVNVNDHANVFAGAQGWITLWSFGLPTDLAVQNDPAAKVFLNHRMYATHAPVLFGRSRGAITYRVSSSAEFGTNYDSPGDFIRIGPGNAWGRNGIFNVVHEYGHAFHFVAIDPWIATAYSCSPNGHAAGVEYTTSCAYVEGFADFFAARVINVVDGSSASSDFLSQNFLEQNPSRAVGNGLWIEDSFAGLLLDLTDAAADDDGIAGDDDAISTMSLFGLGEIMLQCRLSSPFAALLTHSDQFVYCAAGSSGERAFAPAWALGAWGNYAGISYDSPTTLPNQSQFRTIWLYNLYNQ